jgi:hypothetical protein
MNEPRDEASASEAFEREIDTAREALWHERWALIGAAVSLAMLAALALSGCAYLDAAHAVKEEGKAYAARLNDHYAADVVALAGTIPVAAFNRLPWGEKCALAALIEMHLAECTFVAVPAWAGGKE